MALVTHYNLELQQMDIKKSFLMETSNEDVYMDQPECFAIEEKYQMVCKLRSQYMDTNKTHDNGILSLMIP